MVDNTYQQLFKFDLLTGFFKYDLTECQIVGGSGKLSPKISCPRYWNNSK